MMRFEVLGPLRVMRGEDELDLGPREQRRVLALLLAAPDGLSAERIVDELAGESPARTAKHAVEVYVSRLRRLLDDGDATSRIELRHGRYVLRRAAGEVDADDVAAHATAAASLVDRDPTTARTELAQLLARWRGDPYDGLVGDSPLLRAEVARLGRCRERLLTDRSTVDLVLGAHAAVVDELDAVAHAHPYLEPLWAQWMLALYRCGRGVDALRAADELRRRLVEDLGVEPSPAVRDLERRILRQDPRLDWRPPSPPSNLPVPTTSFVGREVELTELEDIARRHRLVTLVGTGGIGKTRLAVALAERLAADYADGVWWVDLATISDPEQVVPTLAATVGVLPAPEPALHAAVIRSLARKRALIAFDNCEQVAAPVADVVAELLRGAPHVDVIATSRVPLHLSSEVAWHVPGLTLVPGASGDEPDAVRLFRTRARDRAPAVASAATPDDGVVELCRRLDGIPLAIEMAARRARELSVEQLIDWLDERFRLLRRSELDVADRQLSMAATLDWSYGRLEPRAQRALDRLAVIAGPFDIAAVTALTGAADELDAADLVGVLVDASMLGVERLGAQPRFRLSETIRDYARQHLADTGELAAAEAAHAAHFLGLAAGAGPAVKTPGFPACASVLRAAAADVRRALQWSITHERGELARLAARGLFGYWFWIGDPRDALHWGEAMLAGVGAEDDSPGVGDAHLCAAFGHDLLGHPADVARHGTDAARVFRACGDGRGLGFALFAVASAALHRGEVAAVARTLQEELAVCEANGDRWGRAGPLAVLSMIESMTGDHAAAEVHAEVALTLHRELGDVAGQVVLNTLPDLARRAGDLPRAQEAAQAMIDAAAGTGWEAVGRVWSALVLTERGLLDDAAREAHTAVLRSIDAGLEAWLRIAICAVGRVAACRGDVATAARLYGGSQDGLPPYPFATAVAAEVAATCRSNLTDERWSALVDAGRAMSDEVLVELSAEVAGLRSRSAATPGTPTRSTASPGR